jgi:lipopolysaccharide/colanic/teichoic acid biosynthesis glycosyltransferase
VLFDHLPTVYEEFTGKIAIENLRPSWLIFSEGFRKTRVLLATKRALDIICALAGLILAAPLLAITAALVKLTSPGPALYHQKRVGLQGREFTVHKFRSMRQDAEAGTGAVWATAGDARVTAVGAFIRRTRLDEIPQL